VISNERDFKLRRLHLAGQESLAMRGLDILRKVTAEEKPTVLDYCVNEYASKNFPPSSSIHIKKAI
jgi:hypothetical protein